MDERRRENPLPHAHALFLRRLANSIVLAAGVVGVSLSIGVLGYHFIAKLGWVDAFVNASMILSGMGPVNELHSSSAKIFAGCYALFSGIMFLTTAAIIFGPLAHRVLHRFHASIIDSEDSGGGGSG